MTHPEIRSFITATADENEREFVDDFVALWSSNRVTFANLRALLEAHDEAVKDAERLEFVLPILNGDDTPIATERALKLAGAVMLQLSGRAAIDASRQQQAGDKT